MARKNRIIQTNKSQNTKADNKRKTGSWTMPKPPPEVRPVHKPKPPQSPKPTETTKPEAIKRKK